MKTNNDFVITGAILAMRNRLSTIIALMCVMVIIAPSVMAETVPFSKKIRTAIVRVLESEDLVVSAAKETPFVRYSADGNLKALSVVRW